MDIGNMQARAVCIWGDSVELCCFIQRNRTRMLGYNADSNCKVLLVVQAYEKNSLPLFGWRRIKILWGITFFLTWSSQCASYIQCGSRQAQGLWLGLRHLWNHLVKKRKRLSKELKAENVSNWYFLMQKREKHLRK